jgi:hypothetical protein
MTQVRLISNLAATEIYNDALEKLRVRVRPTPPSSTLLTDYLSKSPNSPRARTTSA